MSKTLTTTLTIPLAALVAAESLRRALYQLNAADGDFAMSGLDGGDNPYDTTAKALDTTLRFIFASHATPEKVAAYVHGESLDNGENIRYQITEVIGWTLVLTERDGDDESSTTVPASEHPYLSPGYDFR